MKKTLTILLACLTLHAETIYVANVFQNANTGVSSNNAHGTLWLNISTNWANPKQAGKVGPGDVVRFVGIITNSVVGQGDGSSGSYVTFTADDSNAKFSAPTLAAGSKWITLTDCDFLKIDGLTFELTSNGTGMSYSNAMWAIFGSGVTDIVLTNNTFGPLFTRASISNAPPACTAVQLSGSRIYYLSNRVNQVHGGFVNPYGPVVSDTIVINGNTITNFNHGIEIGAGQSVNPIMLNLTISNNRLDGGDAYESPDGVELGLHRDPIFLFNQSGLGGFNGGIYTGYISNYTIANNFIRMGATPQSTTAGTAAMFLESFNNTSYKTGRIYNNISTLVSPLLWSGGGGFIAGRGVDVLIAHNTALGWGSGSTLSSQGQISAVGTNILIWNNICISGQGVSLGAFTPTTFTNNAATIAAVFAQTKSDFNLFNKQNGSMAFVYTMFVDNTGAGQNGLYNTLSEWTNAWSGALHDQFDPHSRTTATTINLTTYAPDNAANFGTNLTSRGIAGLNVDFYGNARPASGVSTVGAVNVGSGPSSTNSPIVVTGKVTLKGAINLKTAIP